MPQLRQDPITRRWVNIATERAKRPTAFTRAASTTVQPSARCPFCEGHESMTPPEVMAYRPPGSEPNGSGWSFRVVPNLYAAFGPADEAPSTGSVGIYETMVGSGVHEVLIDSPDHYRFIADFDLPKVEEIVRGYVDRYEAAAANPFVEYVLISINHGREAGASLEHPHAQLFGIPLIPDNVAEELAGVESYRAEHGRCPYCDIVAAESLAGERVIYENDRFLVFAPFASRVPFESWIVPKAHSDRFEMMTGDQLSDFAGALHALLSKLKRGLNDPPFNLFIHTSPVHAPAVHAPSDRSSSAHRSVAHAGEDGYHWHCELMPKLSIAAGFELGTGIMINTATPESAAEHLRGVDSSATSAPPRFAEDA